MSEPPTTSDEQARLAAARNQARRAAFQLARDSGALIVARPMFHGSAQPTTHDVEPLAGARAARALELGARRTVRDYLRQAREAGHDWDQIGHALGLTPDADPDQAGTTVAEAAYSYAAGSPHSDAARRYGRSVTWTCRSCDQLISDHGLIAGPAEDERGHTKRCARLTAAVAQWDAEWEAEP